MSEELSSVEYCCPGESYSISRAVHLSRLADFYAGCRECPRRDDTAGLSARMVRRLKEIHAQPGRHRCVDSDGIRAVAINDFSPQTARNIAIEFARRLESPIVFACDGRLSTAKIVAAVVEGIRWAGREAIDLGPASVPCMAAAIEHLSAAGGIYLGNPGGRAHTLGMKFWAGGERILQGELLDTLAESFKHDPREPAVDRPTRAYGSLRRINAADAYLDKLRPAYHALRPLRFVLRCSCEPVLAYLADVLRNVACRIIPARAGSALDGQIVAAQAHFGMEIGDDGESALFYDEQGRSVAGERLPEFFAPPPDALRALTLLLVLLSREDAPFSTVLDGTVAAR